MAETRPLKTSNKANIAAGGGVGQAKGKTIEETYQKKTQLEHILLRPDTYVGSVEKYTQKLWVYEDGQMIHREIEFVPGLYKIFDEILVNAADNYQRDPRMNSLKVEIVPEENRISVYNNGDGVPVEVHREEGVYVPELIFGHLLTSSNYDDTEKKTTGGRNGYGAKLTNIFSTEFIIETADGKRQKQYKQVFSNNMTNKSEPMITKCNKSDNWTKVTFKPDLTKFKMDHLEADTVALMQKRVIDMAACLGEKVKIELNGERLPVRSFKQYVDLYLKKDEDGQKPVTAFGSCGRWEFCVSNSDAQFQQVSFVNGIATVKGGTHVDCITDCITKELIHHMSNSKKYKAANVKQIKPHIVKNHMWVFVKALIDNPAFDSQTKETLTTRQSNFASEIVLSDQFKKEVTKVGVVENVLSWVEYKQNKDLKKTDGAKKQRIKGVPKLEDANQAGGRNSHLCTLILTEGDSAKALAVSGLSVVGRDYYGVFPLRGKLLNVREAGHDQIMKNQEITLLKEILGLKQGKEYKDARELRYGHLMIMTDQDHDGSHIKGLIINFIHAFWPDLLKVPSFMLEFITPLLKATHKSGKVIPFYSMTDYEIWAESLGGNVTGWTIKYYKGLGTSSSAEGKEYFQDLEKHKKDFKWEDAQDGDAIELAFSKKKIEARKNWLRQHEPGNVLDQKDKYVKYSDFIHKELIFFSLADLQRSIPSMVDGLKPGQRKVLFCAFKKNLIKEVKISQFAGYVSEKAAYHHGDQSLLGTVVGMAQDFVGSNNINLLYPGGQFGTRLMGGKDHASARYINTRLTRITRFLFPKDDDVLLDYLKEDGISVEPTWYLPVIPMVLVNGSEGIGTGWSTYIPNYNPRDVIANIRRLLNDEMPQPMDPWYRGFNGTIERAKDSGTSYLVNGIIEEEDSETTVVIKELPVRKWTTDYKEFLESNVVSDDRGKASDKRKKAKENDENNEDPDANEDDESSKVQGKKKTKKANVADKSNKAKDKTNNDQQFIKEYNNYSGVETVHFTVIIDERKFREVMEVGLMKKFKLTSTVSTSNMHLFDPRGVIKKYDNAVEILMDFYPLRLEFYVKRKNYYVTNLEKEVSKLENKVRFILGVVKGEIIVNNRKKAELVAELRAKGFRPFPKKTKSVESAVVGAVDDSEEEEGQSEPTANGVESGRSTSVSSDDFDYLLSMAIGTLTREKLEELCSEKDKVSQQLEELRKLSPKTLWMRDLDALEMELDEQDKADEQRARADKMQAGQKVRGQQVKKPRKNIKKTITAAPASDSLMETDDDKPQVMKPRGGAGPKNAAGKKPKQPSIQEIEDEEEHMSSLADRLAAYNLDSPENSAGMDTDPTDSLPAKKGPGRKAAAKKQRSQDEESLGEGDDDVFDISDEDFEAADAGKKGKGRGAVAAKGGKKAAAATKKRGPASKKATVSGQQLITELMKPSEPVGISPEKKVRRMRPSPFNKKSGSVLGQTSEETSVEESGEHAGSISTMQSIDEEVEVMPRRARPQRAATSRKQTVYVSSDSETEEEEEEPTDDSDFNDDED